MTVIRIDITSDWYYVRSQPTSIIHYENANGASQCSKMVNVTTNIIIIMRIIKIKSCHLQSILVLDSCLVLGRWKRNRKGKKNGSRAGPGCQSERDGKCDQVIMMCQWDGFQVTVPCLSSGPGNEIQDGVADDNQQRGWLTSPYPSLYL